MHILTHILLYVHSNIGAIDLVVITQAISHSVTGHHELITVHINVKHNLDACNLSHMCYGLHGGQLKMSHFIAGHHSLSSVHVMHHSMKTDTCTPS